METPVGTIYTYVYTESLSSEVSLKVWRRACVKGIVIREHGVFPKSVIREHGVPKVTIDSTFREGVPW
jgi:hypothetical protein